MLRFLTAGESHGQALVVTVDGLPAGLDLSSALLSPACASIIGPSCVDEQGPVLNASGIAGAADTESYSVASPRSSNLLMRLTWTEHAATPILRATIVDCGGHTGCAMLTSTPPARPGGPPGAAWPPGVCELVVDGWQGKTYRVEIEGDPERDTPYTLAVLYRITCES